MLRRFVPNIDSLLSTMLFWCLGLLAGMGLLFGDDSSLHGQEYLPGPGQHAEEAFHSSASNAVPEEVLEPMPAAELPLLAPNQPSGSMGFFADLLMWNLTEGSAENWAQEITPVGSGTTLGSAALIDAPFQWNTGLRFGVNSQDADGVDMTAYYTNFSTSANNRASGEVYSAFLGNFYVDNTDGAGFGPKYANGSMDWDFSFQSIDLELGQSFMIEESLLLRPFVGLKGAMINQSIHSTWRNPIDTTAHTYLFSSATEDLKQDFWGIGPSFGISATLPFYIQENYSLAIFASPSGSIMYGNWKFRDVYQNDGPTSTTSPAPSTVAINSSPIDGVATMARGTLGLEWNQHFDRFSSTVRLGFETQVWLNQMQFYSYNMGRLNNLMSLQGGVLELNIQY